MATGSSMARHALLGVGIVGALLVTSVVPSGMAPSLEPDDPWLWYVASDGTYGIARQSEVLRARGFEDYHQAGFQHCFGTAPVENTCTLSAYSSWPAPGHTYATGWFAPTLPHDPDGLIPENGGGGSVGAMVASTHLEIRGDYDPAVRVLADCTWATVGVFGTMLAGTPFLDCKVKYDCPYIGKFYCIPRGNITVDFDNGRMYDPSLWPPIDPSLPPLPSTAGLARGVGTWHAFLVADPL